MRYDSITPFASKRNHVCLAQDDNHRSVVVKDFAQSVDCCNQELKVSRALYKHGVAVPRILEASGEQIIYAHIQGPLAIELLEQMELGSDPHIPPAFEAICVWLRDCYHVLEETFGCEMILGDAHLRNFICGNRVYGVDFECVAPGRRETDIAGLAAFAVTYNPSCTQIKYRVAAFICRRCIELMELDPILLHNEIAAQLSMIAARRKITFPQGIIDELWSRVTYDDLSPMALPL